MPEAPFIDVCPGQGAIVCPGCGGANNCAIADGEPATSCWCMQSSAGLPLPEAADTSCYCAACLQKILRNQPLFR